MNTTLAIAALLIGLFATQQSFAQTTTTLNFDSIADGVEITDQYASVGVTVQGATSMTARNFGLTAHSGTQFAFSGSGLVTFSVSIPNVQTVSAYITGPVDVGIYAYDASGNLLGQQILPANSPENVLMSVTSSGAPIAKVAVHDGGATFFIDDISFTTAAPPEPICRTYDKNLYNAVSALSSTAFVCTKTATADKSRILSKITNFETLRANKAGQAKLLSAMQDIQKDVRTSVKAANAKSILQQIDQLLALIKANGC